jgi:hypothetical protein
MISAIAKPPRVERKNGMVGPAGQAHKNTPALMARLFARDPHVVSPDPSAATMRDHCREMQRATPQGRTPMSPGTGKYLIDQ